MGKGSQAILTHETIVCALFGLSTIKRYSDLVGATLVLTTANGYTNGQRASITHTYGVGSTTSYSYNRNRLTDITYKTSAGGSVSKRVHYAYDSSDQRITKQVDANGDNTYESAEQYVYDGDQVVLILNASGTVISRFMQGVEVDQTIAQEQGGNVQWYLSDHENTVRWVINSTGVLRDNITYGAFGNIISQTDAAGNPLPANSNDIPRFSYTSREWDADANLFYYRARWFDAAAGRFINQDPIGFAAGDGNLYRYCGNNPLNAIDPTGTIDYNPGGGREFRGNSPSQNYDNRYGTSSGNGGGGNAKPVPTPVYASVNAVKTQVNSQYDTRVNMAVSGGGGTNYYSGSSGTGGGAVASTRVWGSDPIQLAVAVANNPLVNSIYTGQATRRYVHGTTATAPEPDFSIYGPIQGLPPAGSGISQDEQDFQNSSGVFGPPAPIKQPTGPYINLMGQGSTYSGDGLSRAFDYLASGSSQSSNMLSPGYYPSWQQTESFGSYGSMLQRQNNARDQQEQSSIDNYYATRYGSSSLAEPDFNIPKGLVGLPGALKGWTTYLATSAAEWVTGHRGSDTGFFTTQSQYGTGAAILQTIFTAGAVGSAFLPSSEPSGGDRAGAYDRAHSTKFAVGRDQ